ncbi:hypothetical protein LguiA_030658 [Lonicera macranthoides]
MSNFNLSKKLQPARKAWKSLTTTLHSKFPKRIKKLTKHLTPLPLIRRKPPRSTTHHHHLSKPIFVDELFAEPSANISLYRPKMEDAKTNMKTEQKQSLAPKDNIKAGESSKGKWDVKMLPKVKGVDERAEEFISKLKQDMKIEREQSILDFQEMLARSV